MITTGRCRVTDPETGLAALVGEGGTPRTAISVALLVGGALILDWVVSSAASRGQGFFFFLAGLLLLAVGLFAFRLGSRSVLYGVLYVFVLAAATSLALEAILHVWPGVLRGQVANVAYTGYHWQRGGIYGLDPHRGPVLLPSVRRRMYWSGHWWWHETNANGYRGPAQASADAVFLGDSMIYGHGVEADQTVPARFAAHTGLAVANLGQQGTCLVQAFLTFRATGKALRPRLVFVSVHPTDLDEVVRYYPEDELRRFATEPGHLVGARPEYSPKPWWNAADFWARRISLPMRAGGILGAVWRAGGTGQPGLRKPEASDGHFVPPERELSRPFPPEEREAANETRLAWAAERRALAEIHRETRAMGARLVVLDMGYPRAYTEAVEKAAAEIGATYSPAGRRILEHALRGEEVYLADDGHWSPLGCDLMARELAAHHPSPWVVVRGDSHPCLR